MTTEKVRDILEKLNFPRRYTSEQTAICIIALLDKTQRPGLLPGHKNLNDGARIHDILNFARDVVGKKVAENTREAYRKTSLTPFPPALYSGNLSRILHGEAACGLKTSRIILCILRALEKTRNKGLNMSHYEKKPQKRGMNLEARAGKESNSEKTLVGQNDHP